MSGMLQMKGGLELTDHGFNEMVLVEPLFFNRIKRGRFHVTSNFSNKFEASICYQ